MSELNPCICGGKAELKEKNLIAHCGWGKSYFSYHVECADCGMTGDYFNTIEHLTPMAKAIEEWNRRAGE